MFGKEAHLVMSSLVLAVLVAIDTIFKDSMMRQSIKMSKLLTIWPSVFYYWYWIFAVPIFMAIPVISHVCLFVLKNKSHAILIFLIVATENTVSNLIKLIYHDLRPCFIDNQIAAIKCTCSFGKPSGHSSSSIVLYTTLYYLLVYKNSRFSNKNKIIGFVTTILIILNVGISRIYFGAHFINQVFIGWSLGYLILSCFYYLYEINFFRVIVFSSKAQQSKRNMLINTIIIFFTLIQGFLIIAWYFAKYYFENNPYHPFNKTSCVDKCFKSGGFLSDYCISAAGFYTSVIYLFIGFKLHRGEIASPSLNFYSKCYANIPTSLKRLAVFVIVSSPLIVGFVIAQKKGFYIWIVLNFCALIFAIAFFFVMKPLLTTWNVSFVGDYFEKNEIACYQEMNVEELEIK